MKQTKILRLLSLLLIMSLFLQGCKSPFVTHRHPITQPNSAWVTDDGMVAFYTGANEIDHVYGSIKTTDSAIEIVVDMSTLVSVVEFYYKKDICVANGGDPPNAFAYGHGKILSKSKFRIDIAYAEVFFEEGQTLIFCRGK